jgi:superkiller protein 3
VPLLTAAQQRYPQDFWLNFKLGNALWEAKQEGAAIGYYRAALALRPNNSVVYNNLGIALYNNGELDGAIACLHKALAMDPKYAYAHINLGLALDAKGDLDGAIACYQKALALDPKFAPAHHNLGGALADKGDLEGAIACYHQALALNPKFVMAHTNLGNALKAQGQLDQAIACYEQALALDPKTAKAHAGLGIALAKKGQLDQAIACFEKALAIDPKDAKAHYNLGVALKDKGQLDKAIACYAKALALDPKYAQAHGALGAILLVQGRFREARGSTRRCLQLLPNSDPQRHLGSRQLQVCERLLVLESRLPAALTGKVEPASASERQEYALLCSYQKRYAEAARLSAAAFAAEPNLARGNRYSAACWSTLAAAGQGKDAASLGEQDRARLRQQALTWLKAELAIAAEVIEKGAPRAQTLVQGGLARWQRDPALAGIRDAAALASLPAEEREACRKLWADVAALLKRSSAP